jgi:SAM-dependent methyltransferase/uncharacterized protein YukE
MADEKLYESAAVWDQELQVGQRNLIQAICDHWPKGARTALDVGCGDGKITHALAEYTNASFHGFDGSREALSRLLLPSTHGDVSTLPFDDDAFDVVLTTDVFEHLPDQVEQAAWQELFRVARDWVFFAVPFREELLDGSTKCAKCGKQYHVNWHHRSYDIADVTSRTPPGWSMVLAVLSGERWSPMLPPETRYRRLTLGEWSGWSEAICPACGTPSQPPNDPSMLATNVARALGQYIYGVISERRFVRSHSELLVIFRRADLSFEHDAIPTCDTEAIPAAQWVTRLGVVKNLDPYPQTARMVSSVDGGYVAQFPVYPGSLPFLSIVACRTATIPVVVEDGCGLVFSGDVDLYPEAPTKIALPREPRAGYYGLIVHLPSIDFLESITLEGTNPLVTYLFPFLGESCYYDVPGTKIRVQVTDPLWIDCESLVSPLLRMDQLEMTAIHALLRAEKAHEDTIRESLRLQSSCEQLSQENARLQSACEQLSQENVRLQSSCEQLSQENARLQSACEQLNKEVKQFTERIEVRICDRIRRILRSHRKS